MFIVARRKGQRILIGDDIEVIVAELSRSTVKLGIVAPRTCSIMRGELKDCVEQANRDALVADLSAPDGGSLQGADGAVQTDTRLVDARAFLRSAVNNLAHTDVNLETLAASTGTR
jgi:carbon storage regulator